MFFVSISLTFYIYYTKKLEIPQIFKVLKILAVRAAYTKNALPVAGRASAKKINKK